VGPNQLPNIKTERFYSFFRAIFSKVSCFLLSKKFLLFYYFSFTIFVKFYLFTNNLLLDFIMDYSDSYCFIEDSFSNTNSSLIHFLTPLHLSDKSALIFLPFVYNFKSTQICPIHSSLLFPLAVPNTVAGFTEPPQ
jgi:hypothetical protein